LIISSSTPAKLAFLIWLVVGLIIYFSYSRKHSALRLKGSTGALASAPSTD
jgi:basic amino acid/polyamine antiporter, APA family